MFPIPARYMLAALAACATLGSAMASEPTQVTDVSATPNAMRAAIDPTTGKLRVPTAAEIRKYQSKARATPRGAMQTQPRNESEAIAQSRRLKNGTVAIRVPLDRFTSIAATRDGDGLHLSEQAGTATRSGQSLDTAESTKGVAK